MLVFQGNCTSLILIVLAGVSPLNWYTSAVSAYFVLLRIYLLILPVLYRIAGNFCKHKFWRITHKHARKFFFFFCNRVITYYHTSNNFTLCTTQNGDYFVKNLCHSAWEDQRRRCANICHMALPARASQCQYENSGTPASLISHALNEILALGIPRYTYGQLVATAFFCIVGKEIQSKYREKNKILN